MVKKALALTFVGCGACGLALAGAQALQAILLAIQGSPILNSVILALLSLFSAWLFFVGALRMLVSVAKTDPEARALLATSVGVFRLLPAPASMRKASTTVSGLDLVSRFE